MGLQCGAEHTGGRLEGRAHGAIGGRGERAQTGAEENPPADPEDGLEARGEVGAAAGVERVGDHDGVEAARSRRRRSHGAACVALPDSPPHARDKQVVEPVEPLVGDAVAEDARQRDEAAQGEDRVAGGHDLRVERDAVVALIADAGVLAVAEVFVFDAVLQRGGGCLERVDNTSCGGGRGSKESVLTRYAMHMWPI